MFFEQSRILYNESVGGSCFKMGISCNLRFQDALPGQFIMIGIKDCCDPLLKRPFSIHRVVRDINGIELLYKVVGRSTQKFSLLEKGESVSLMGPIGSGFSVIEEAKRIFMVAGGIGVAPMVFLADFLLAHGVNPKNCGLFVGGRTKDDILCVKEFESADIPVFSTTEDGSYGSYGLITSLLKDEITKDKPDIIYACGPHPMLKSLAVIAAEAKIRCQISIESVMACGVGACLGCAVCGCEGDEQPFLHVCKDGPVFEADLLTL